MKKIILTAISAAILLIFFQISTKSPADAGWWERPTAFPTRPVFDREEVLPTSPPLQPTATPIQPTATPRVGDSTTPGDGGSISAGAEDPCAPGKSYVGPYCGWSPRVGGEEGGGGGEQPLAAGPQVLGLSDTSSGDLALSDIMILAGILCLALYAKSKFAVDNNLH